MKRLASFLLLFLYLLSVEGIRVSRHFCGNEIAHVSCFSTFDEKDCCGVDRCTDCCYDDHVSVKISTEHVGKTHVQVCKSLEAVSAQPKVLPRLVYFTKPIIVEKVFKPYDFNCDVKKKPKYILHCTWLI